MSNTPSHTPRPAYWHDTQHSMVRRNDNIDYHRGRMAYMLTLHIEDRKPLLSSLPALSTAALSATAPAASLCGATRCAIDLRPLLTPLGKAMRQAWLSLPERFPEITIRDRADEWVIMPEHFHGILFINENMLEHLSDIEKLFKQRVTMAYRKLLIEGAIEPVGQAREWLAAYRALPSAQQAATAAWIERQLALLYSATRCGTQGDSSPIRVCASGQRKELGFLFAHSYNDKPFWDEATLADKQHYILNNPINRIRRNSNPDWLRAQRGGIDTALAIETLNGFPEVYHPSEDRQALCAEGRYLIVTPWQYEYRSEDAVLEVAFCKTMNCVAQAISRTKDDWWKRTLPF